jgi:hypothetical protein
LPMRAAPQAPVILIPDEDIATCQVLPRRQEGRPVTAPLHHGVPVQGTEAPVGTDVGQRRSGVERFDPAQLRKLVYETRRKNDFRSVAGKLVAAYGKGDEGAELAVMMKHWMSDVVACSDGTPASRNVARPQMRNCALGNGRRYEASETHH